MRLAHTVSYTESGMNSAGQDRVIGERQTVAEFGKPEYRFLVVANKFQTGFDQPLLHTMYVDKKVQGRERGSDALSPESATSCRAGKALRRVNSSAIRREIRK